MNEKLKDRLDTLLFVGGILLLLAAVAIGVIGYLKHHDTKVAVTQPACKLLTQADVRSVATLKDATQQSTADKTTKFTQTRDVYQSACAYKTADTTVNILAIQALTKKGQPTLDGTVSNFTNGGNGLTSASATQKVTNFGKNVTAYYNSNLHYLLVRKGNFVVEMATITGNGDTTSSTNDTQADQANVLALAKIVLPKISTETN